MKTILKALLALFASCLLLSSSALAQEELAEPEVLEEIQTEDYLSEDEIYEDLKLAEAEYGLEVLEPEPSFVIPKGTTVMEDEDIIFDVENVVEITTNDAKEFISEKFLYWAFERADKNTIASITYDANNIGDCGRFYVPDLGVNVAIYYANEMNAPFAQQIVDAEDAGVYTPHIGGEPYLADHSSQAFAGLKMCREGMMAYWKHVDRIDIFYCTRTCHGTNDGLFIYDDEEENCFFQNEGGFFTYTCLEDWQHVAIAFWQPVGTLWL